MSSNKDKECPSQKLMTLLSGTWTLTILWVLCKSEPIRFGDLRRAVIGISAKVLTQRLRMLEEASLIYRNYQAVIPPRVTYSLAERGHDLVKVLALIDEISEQ